MDCYYHHAVPSIDRLLRLRSNRSVRPAAPKPATAPVAAWPPASTPRRGPSGAAGGRVPPRPSRAAAPAAPAADVPAAVATRRSPIRPESRALVALGYPFWPLALLALFDGSHSPFVRKQAWQALGFNFGIYGMWFALSAIAAIPVIGMSAWPLLPFVIPVAFVASVVYGFKVWQGEDVRVPFISDYVESRTTNA